MARASSKGTPCFARLVRALAAAHMVASYAVGCRTSARELRRSPGGARPSSRGGACLRVTERLRTS
jgi:hypothetical protein